MEDWVVQMPFLKTPVLKFTLLWSSYRKNRNTDDSLHETKVPFSNLAAKRKELFI
jgi:hypothetical protein